MPQQQIKRPASVPLRIPYMVPWEYKTKDLGNGTRKSSFFKLEFKKDIKPMLIQCQIKDFKGQNKREAANRLLQYVRDNCTTSHSFI